VRDPRDRRAGLFIVVAAVTAAALHALPATAQSTEGGAAPTSRLHGDAAKPSSSSLLRPGRLPAGMTADPEQDETIPDGSGGAVSYRSQRFHLPELRGMLALELVTGPDLVPAMKAGQRGRRMAVEAGEVTHADLGQDMREIRWRVGATAVLSAIGTGDVSVRDLVAAATSMASDLRPRGPVKDEPSRDEPISALAYQGLPATPGRTTTCAAAAASTPTTGEAQTEPTPSSAKPATPAAGT
jgi:hypothetical protein